MSERIEINHKIFLREYKYRDREEFQNICIRSAEKNYYSLMTIWNRGINVYLVYRRILFMNINIGFLCTIDYRKLSNREKEMLKLFEVPNKFAGIFINDMIISNRQKRKGFGTLVVNKLLEKKDLYMLEPVKEGIQFWKKFGFTYEAKGKFATLDNR